MRETNRIAMIFWTMAAVLLATFIAIYLIGLNAIHAGRQVTTHHVTLAELQNALATVRDAETGQRGYVLTGKNEYLAPYNNAVSKFDTVLTRLHGLTISGSVAAQSIDRIEELSRRKLAELTRTVELRRDKGFEAAMAVVNTDVGQNLMEDLRKEISLLSTREENELSNAMTAADQATHYRNAVLAACIVLDLGFLWWAFRRMSAEINRRLEMSGQIARERDLLAVTLASIGDAVIVTDLKGNITFINNVAEELTGWRVNEAKGRPCAEVFHIINEESRAMVESPVDKVLREGVIVGLANHTLLIRRDGTEIPIDDSGAPIRESDGAVRGAVLIFRDFSEHKTSEKQLKAMNESLATANRAKDHFLATLSHELRTPLTPVLATLSMWEASEELPGALKTDVEMLRRNVELEARLIDDLLDLTRIAKGKMRMSLEVVPVHRLVQEVTDMYASEIRAKQLKLSIELDAAADRVTADSARLQQVIWNVLKNATKFTPEGGEISIRTENDTEGRIKMSISDTGIGMNEETLSRLFRAFEQGREEIVRRYGGLGLGMALSKAIVDALGGTIEASSDGANRGSCFTITLPALAEASRSSAPAKPIFDSDYRPQRRLKVLVVEDHADTGQVLVRVLQGMGHEVQFSSTVAEARQLIESEEFDLLLSDIGLPDGTGIDLLQQIKEHYSNPAIALTGFGMEDDLIKCREAGFAAHLTKPVNFQKLSATIRQLATS